MDGLLIISFALHLFYTYTLTLRYPAQMQTNKAAEYLQLQSTHTKTDPSLFVWVHPLGSQQPPAALSLSLWRCVEVEQHTIKSSVLLLRQQPSQEMLLQTRYCIHEICDKFDETRNVYLIYEMCLCFESIFSVYGRCL